MVTDRPDRERRDRHDARTNPAETPDATELSTRIRAIERALTEAEDPPTPLPAVSAVASDIESLTERVTELETTVAELEARQSAVEAYADRIEHVNEAVERRADAALAAVDRLESATETGDNTTAEPHSSDSAMRVSDATQIDSAMHVSDAAAEAPTQSRYDDQRSDESPATAGEPDRGLVARLLGL